MTRALRRFDNRLKRFRALTIALNLTLFAIVAQAQQPSTRDDTQQSTGATPAQMSQKNTEARRIQAVRVTDVIKIDGLLDEPGWSLAQPAADFLQQQPTEGAPASERTEVRVLFDDKNIYFGIRAFDSDAAHINARELVRDAGFSNDDTVSILLDTYHDRRNAFRFEVNPLGTQQDALITDEGRDINVTWNGSWISAGRIDDKGYTVEIEIPLTTLRFKEGIESWGFNVSRVIRRKNEQSLWTSWQRSFGLERVSQAGELAGVEEIRRRRLREIKPYASGEWREGIPLIGRNGLDAGVRANVGIEVAKLGITPSLTAEFTVNPDFGQAEVDDQIVNLSRFSVFFPEKRDFFLENQATQIQAIMEATGAQEVAPLMRQLLDEALAARRRKSVVREEVEQPPPTQDVPETLQTIQTLLLRIIGQGQTALRIERITLELLQETLVEARAGRIGLWETLAVPSLRERGSSAQHIADLFDAKTEEAKDFAYGLAEEIRDQPDTVETDSASATVEDDDRQERFVYDPPETQDTDPAVA